MSDAGRPANHTVHFFGCDCALRAAMEREAEAQGLKLRAVQTVAGLMHAAHLRPVRVLILEAECLPPWRSAAALLGRLESEAGSRPRLIALAPPGGSRTVPGPGSDDIGREAVATFQPPFEVGPILARASVALTERPVRLPRLLFVDALEAEGEALAAAMREQGFEVVRLADPHQAIPALAARPADLVVLDLGLPADANRALSAALRVHPTLWRLPILYLAAQPGVDQSTTVLRLGRDEYLARPVSPAAVAAAVRERLARATREARTRVYQGPLGRPTDGHPHARVDRPDDEQVLDWVREALTDSGFHLVYQPILSLRRHQERYEALLRLTTPAGEVLPPLTFLPVAARHGLLPALDRWVLSAGLATLCRERDAGRPTRLVVFQCGASLAEPGWLDWLRAEVARQDLIRQRPAVEFNVHDILDHEDQARLLFPELARLGIEVCLAGISEQRDCLGLIARRSIATAKLAHDQIASTNAAGLSALVEALHQRGARVIAAGIEDPDTIARLWSSGVDYVQGNYIQPPRETLDYRFTEGLHG